MSVFLSSLLCRVHFVMEKPDQNHVPVVFMLHLNFFMTVFSVCYTAVCFFLIATYLVRPYSTLPFLLWIFSYYVMHPVVGCSLFEMETCHDLDSGLDSLCLDWKVDRHTMGNNWFFCVASQAAAPTDPRCLFFPLEYAFFRSVQQIDSTL